MRNWSDGHDNWRVRTRTRYAGGGSHHERGGACWEEWGKQGGAADEGGDGVQPGLALHLHDFTDTDRHSFAFLWPPAQHGISKRWVMGGWGGGYVFASIRDTQHGTGRAAGCRRQDQAWRPCWSGAGGNGGCMGRPGRHRATVLQRTAAQGFRARPIGESGSAPEQRQNRGALSLPAVVDQARHPLDRAQHANCAHGAQEQRKAGRFATVQQRVDSKDDRGCGSSRCNGACRGIRGRLHNPFVLPCRFE